MISDDDAYDMCLQMCDKCECFHVCKYYNDEPMKCKEFENCFNSLKDGSAFSDQQYEERRDLEWERLC